MIKIDLNDHNE